MTEELILSRAIPQPDGCWRWTGPLAEDGYGTVNLDYQQLRAHRWFFEYFWGAIPEGLMVMHSCDVRACVNPSHLSVGTCKENMQDAARKGRTLQGSRNPISKLTEEAVLEIRATSRNTKRLAEKFGVSIDAIKLARSGKTWKHVSRIEPSQP